MITPKQNVQTNAQRVFTRHKKIKQLKRQITTYVDNLPEDKVIKLKDYYSSNNIIGKNKVVFDSRFCSPVAHDCFKAALNIPI